MGPTRQGLGRDVANARASGNAGEARISQHGYVLAMCGNCLSAEVIW